MFPGNGEAHPGDGENCGTPRRKSENPVTPGIVPEKMPVKANVGKFGDPSKFPITQHIQLRFLSVRQHRDVLLLGSRRLVTEVPASALNPDEKRTNRHRVELVLCCLDRNLELSVLNLSLLLEGKSAEFVVILENGGHLCVGEAKELFYLGKGQLGLR